MEDKVCMNQVHGNNVVVVGIKDIGKTISNCDGLITNKKGITLVVKTADCLPILFKDIKNNVIGVVHAGWRGLQNGIISNAIEIMVKKFKTNPENVIVGIGPHICKNHYEVKSDVSQYFAEITTKNNKTYLDLAKVAVNQLIKVGVKEKNIRVDNKCTLEDINLPSYRRNKNSGRLEMSIEM